MTRSPREKGFVALISVILISAVLLTLVITLNLSSFFARYDALGGENKRISLGLAEACVEAAKLKIAQNAAYTPASGGDSITVNGAKTCRICAVSANGGNSYTIKTRAVMNNSYSNVVVDATITQGTFSVTGWSENSQYSGPICALP